MAVERVVRHPWRIACLAGRCAGVDERIKPGSPTDQVG
jgi:hypothetical protein